MLLTVIFLRDEQIICVPNSNYVQDDDNKHLTVYGEDCHYLIPMDSLLYLYAISMDAVGGIEGAFEYLTEYLSDDDDDDDED